MVLGSSRMYPLKRSKRFEVKRSGVQDLGFRFQDSRVQVWIRVRGHQGLGFKVWDLGVRAWG